MPVLIGLLCAYVTLRIGWLTLKSLPSVLANFRQPKDESSGQISPISAFATGLGATVSAGSAVGVAAAIHHGGPGALFWMWVTAALLIPIKFAQTYVSAQYRDQGRTGPMVYAASLGKTGLSKALAGLGLLAALGWGAATQASVGAEAAHMGLGLPVPLTAGVCALIALLVASGGIKRVAAICTALVPFVLLAFTTAVLILLVLNYRRLTGTVHGIRDGVMHLEAGVGGALAGIFTITLGWGIKAAFLSSELLTGSAAIILGDARQRSARALGALASFMPIIDTLVISSLVGLCIIVTHAWDNKTQTTVPMNQVAVIPAAFMEMSGQQTEYEWIEAGLLGIAATSTAAPTTLVEDGDQPDFFFVVEHGLVDTAILLDAHDQPYSGPLTLDLSTGRLTPCDLRLSGLMLRTHVGLLAQAFSKGFDSPNVKLGAVKGNGPATIGLFLLLFALTTMIVWAHVGSRFAEHLGGQKLVWPFRGLFGLAIIAGGFLSTENAMALGEVFITLLGLATMAALLIGLGRLNREP